jgi:hypothetical protein
MVEWKLTRIDIKTRGPLSKEALLELIKKELDKEFPTDLVEQSKITVTCDHIGPRPPKPPKKGKKK